MFLFMFSVYKYNNSIMSKIFEIQMFGDENDCKIESYKNILKIK